MIEIQNLFGYLNFVFWICLGFGISDLVFPCHARLALSDIKKINLLQRFINFNDLVGRDGPPVQFLFDFVALQISDRFHSDQAFLIARQHDEGGGVALGTSGVEHCLGRPIRNQQQIAPSESRAADAAARKHFQIIGFIGHIHKMVA